MALGYVIIRCYLPKVRGTVNSKPTLFLQARGHFGQLNAVEVSESTLKGGADSL